MSTISINTPFNISLDFAISPFWKRLLAFVIDFTILYIYQKVYQIVFASLLPENEGLMYLIIIFTLILPILLYHFLSEVFFYGQSIGKRILKIRVVNITGNDASISQYLIRLLLRSYILAPLGAFIIIILFDEFHNAENALQNAMYVILILLGNLGMFLYYILNKKGQRLGDVVANTLVIETTAYADFHKTIYQDISEEQYQVKYPEVMRLTDRDINGIRNMLDVKRITPESENYMYKIATRIESVLNIKSNQEPYDFLAQLLRDYNFLTSK